MARKAKPAVKIVKKPITEHNVIAATFDLIAAKGLGKVSISALAAHFKQPVAAFYAEYKSVDTIIGRFLDRVDANMLENIGAESDKRDIYFDLLMSRFDTLQENRAGVKRWLADLPKFPLTLAGVLKRWEQSLSLMLDVAKDSPKFPLKKIGLGLVYLASLRSWIKDDSDDMAKTMSAVDQNLGKAGEIVDRFMTRKRV